MINLTDRFLLLCYGFSQARQMHMFSFFVRFSLWIVVKNDFQFVRSSSIVNQGTAKLLNLVVQGL